MHVILFGNAPHVIKLPSVWGADNVRLNRAMQYQKSLLFRMLKNINGTLTGREIPGDVIYYLDTMPVYINSSVSMQLNKGKKRFLPYQKQ